MKLALERLTLRLAIASLLPIFLGVAFSGETTEEFLRRVAPPPITPNRILPTVSPPRPGLTFRPDPTAQEIFRARVFEEPLVPVGREPSPAENADLASALLAYSKRTGPDDFSSLTVFLQRHPRSPWRAALLTDLGLEYYSTAHYSLALDAWAKAWSLAKDATDAKGKAVGDRAAGELAYMYARIGRMTELDALLKSVEGRVFLGPATEKISGARQGLSNMKDRPEIAFRCGPLALHRIKVATDPKNPQDLTIYKSASTQKGFSLPQVAELAAKVGLNYQMAFRERGAEFVVPAVVHWKVGHYAAVVRREGDRYLLQDPTFWNDVWATKKALEGETSGYFLIPPGTLPRGWRAVEAKEAAAVWGKGNTCCNDPDPHGCNDKKKQDSCGGPPCKGLAVANVHLMLVSLNIMDQPLGYKPPVGPLVDFNVTYNHREANQPATFTYSNFGSKWTFDWLSYIKDNPLTPSADVKFYMLGGGTRTFTGFNTNTQSFASQQFDQTRLTRTSATSYEMVLPDGSRRIFNQSDGSTGSSRKIFLTQLVDPFGNAISLTYDSDFRVVALRDAIGQVTTIVYENQNDIYKITRVTDPFGRFATFDYDPYGRLIKITDVIGLTSQFVYEGTSDFINALITPYGTNTFIRGESGTTRWLETIFPDGDRDRVEYNQSTSLGTPVSVPANQLPVGMATHNDYLWYRNTYYWSKFAYASTYPDYTKARLYHWLHTGDGASTSGILESEKEALEGRVWYDYVGQSDPIGVGTTDQPTHVGRVLDDGTTQLYTYEYDGFGHTTKMIDPIGRTFSYIYATNGIDLLEVRQIRAGNNELLSKTTYNAQHRALTFADAAGQVTTHTYNTRGQLLTVTDARGALRTASYDSNGYLLSVDGALPGAGDSFSWTYDAFGRVRTKTDESGYTLTFDYDNLDRLTKITCPDGTYEQFTYTFLDNTQIRDRAGRLTTLEYNRLRQMSQRTDPLGRVTLFQWCKCGDTKSITDPLGRTTTWFHDIQSRPIRKEFADGSNISFQYENTTSRISQRTDERMQVTRYSYNLDDTLASVGYVNTAVPTSPVTFQYDPSYRRVTSMRDATGVTTYAFNPITTTPTLGAGRLASIDGPLPNDTITFGYDANGERVSRAVNGVTATTARDLANRIVGETNALGAFAYAYDGSSMRMASQTFPNGGLIEQSYGGNAQDNAVQRVTHTRNASKISEFLYTRDPAAGHILTWSQQATTQTPTAFAFSYDAADQVTGADATTGGVATGTYAYSYDPDGNRLTERVANTTNAASYNALNQLTALTGSTGTNATYEWDAEQRLTAINSTNRRTEFTYDGLGHRVGIRQLLSGSEVSNRRLLWCEDDLIEERTAAGSVTKRFLPQGVKIENGPNAGAYYYTRDHLGSIREMVDSSGNIRARYSYDPFGRRTRVAGDLDADFGFAGMFWSGEAALALTRYRAYDPEAGRWLSRDPVKDAEIVEGPNLYAYVRNNPVNAIDPLGLCCEKEEKDVDDAAFLGGIRCNEARAWAEEKCEELSGQLRPSQAELDYCARAKSNANRICREAMIPLYKAIEALAECKKKPCHIFCICVGPYCLSF